MTRYRSAGLTAPFRTLPAHRTTTSSCTADHVFTPESIRAAQWPPLEGGTMATRLLCVTVLSLSVLVGVRARAITAGVIDVNNVFENVGATLITLRAGNPLGLPEGTLIGNCTGTLIHPRVVLVAGHCVAPGVAVPGIPAWPGSIRPVVSFSHDNPRDPSTWVDVEVMYIHPSFPCRAAPLTCCSGAPNQPCPVGADGRQVPALTPFFDIGVMVLTAPITNLKLAKLANDGFLEK